MKGTFSKPILLSVGLLAPLGLWFGPQEAAAWLIQAPYKAGQAPEEVQAFQQASGAALTAFSRFHAELARAENEHDAFRSEVLSEILAELDRVVSVFRQLADSKLNEVPLSLAALRDVSELLASELATSDTEVNNVAGLAGALGEIAFLASKDISILREYSSFGPDDPMNIAAREATSEAVSHIAQFIKVGNAGSVAIGISQTQQ